MAPLSNLWPNPTNRSATGVSDLLAALASDVRQGKCAITRCFPDAAIYWIKGWHLLLLSVYLKGPLKHIESKKWYCV